MKANKDRSEQRQPGTTGKVGSDRSATDAVGGKNDFGIPADRATVDPGGRAKGPEQGTGFSRSGSRAIRTSGVGAPVGSDGSGSGGDIDSDIIGLDGRGGLSAKPADRDANGPDMAQPENEHSSHPAPRKTRTNGVYDTVDHSGGDVTTSGDESSESTNPEIEEIAQESDLGRV